MKCPRCSNTVPNTPDPQGFLMCPGCGARLRSRAASTVAPGTTAAPAARPGGPAFNPDSTLPPGLMATPRPASVPAAAPRPQASPAPVPAPAAARPAPAPAAPSPAPMPAAGVSLEALMTELRAVRRVQEEILDLLRSEPRSGGSAPPESFTMDGPDRPERPERPSSPPGPGPVRARRRKTVLLLDDDDATCNAAMAALQQAEVPVRVARDGNAGLAAIAAEKPDVIAMELDLGGPMAGKDVINMIKATMEWVDIPIVLYTRWAVESQKEARTEHGADDYVIKGPQGAAELVSRVVALFRRA